MEATTLDQAVDSLLAPQEGSPESNLDEAVEAMVEPTDDDQSEVVEETEEDQDVIEASDDEEYEDDATEYTDDVEAVDEDDSESLIDVKINGKWERRTLSELKQDYAGQSYIQQKMRENAEAAKQVQTEVQQLEAAKAQLAQQQEAVLNMYNQMQQGDFTQPTPPSKELLESDPIGYMQQKEAYEAEVTEYNAKVQQMQQMQQQRAQQSEAQKAAHRQEQMQLLHQRIPDFADPQKYEKAAQDMLRGGTEFYGVPQEALMQLTDAVEIEILYDAVRYRRLQANRKNVDAKAKQAKPVVKAGAKRTQDGQAVTRKKAQDRLRKSGSIQDAMNLIIDSKL